MAVKKQDLNVRPGVDSSKELQPQDVSDTVQVKETPKESLRKAQEAQKEATAETKEAAKTLEAGQVKLINNKTKSISVPPLPGVSPNDENVTTLADEQNKMPVSDAPAGEPETPKESLRKAKESQKAATDALKKNSNDRASGLHKAYAASGIVMPLEITDDKPAETLASVIDQDIGGKPHIRTIATGRQTEAMSIKGAVKIDIGIRFDGIVTGDVTIKTGSMSEVITPEMVFNNWVGFQTDEPGDTVQVINDSGAELTANLQAWLEY